MHGSKLPINQQAKSDTDRLQGEGSTGKTPRIQ